MLDPNWLAVLLFLIAVPVTNLVAFQQGRSFSIPSSFTLGAIAAGYFFFYRHSREHLSRLQTFILASALAGIVAALSAASGLIYLLAHRASAATVVEEIIGGVGLAAFFYCLHQFAKQTAYVRWIQFPLICAVGAFVFSGPITQFCLKLSVANLPYVADSIFQHVDAQLSLDQFGVLARLVAKNGWLRQTLSTAYFSIGFVSILVAYLEIKLVPKPLTGLIYRLFAASCFGYLLYFMLPAMGPLYFYGNDFPFLDYRAIDNPNWVMTTAEAPRNCMPSLHATSAIFILLALRYAPVWQRALGMMFVMLTFAATLGLGEHYGIDWLAAPPLVLFVRSITCIALPMTDRWRLLAGGVGAAFLAGWVIILRAAPDSLSFQALLALFAAASVLLPLYLESILAQVERRQFLGASFPANNPDADYALP